MFSKNHPIILFIDRNGFSVFQDTQPNILKFNFTPDLVANLDLINKEQFSNLIATFIQINKIAPSSLGVILSDSVIYTKDFPNQPPSNNEYKEEIQNFLDDVPFEEVLAKVIKTGNINRIVAANKDLIMTIAGEFANKGSTIEAITPSFMYGQNANFTVGLTLDNALVILENAETLKEGNLLTDQKQNPPGGAKSDLAGGEKQPQNLRQYILIGVLATLLVILAVVYLNLGASQTPPPSKKMKSFVETISAPTVTPILTQQQITTVPVDIKNIKVKIVQNSQSDTVASNLKSELLKIGFQDIASEVSQASIPEKSSVVFSQNVPTDVRNIAITEIKKVLPNILILENQDSSLMITILIGKS